MFLSGVRSTALGVDGRNIASMTEHPQGELALAPEAGGDFPDARATVRYPQDDVDDVRQLTETRVPELVGVP